ncbi:MAG: hypothetical protein NBV68_06380 [Erythrobacter sp.]|uniref:hypothetical protein n=1 Tax=Erythrobacter sp. TaxID=1042 RepID=UPI0025D10762|nr:hypothetical protein [Erythrobacter sp.]MCL9998989.1 hypothetical protein [Erythrobacter sp.]
MSLILALALAQAPAFTGTVPQPNPALDAAHACLLAGVAERLAAEAPAPIAEERWRWALAVADRCDAELNAAADSPEAARLYDEVSHGSITKRQALRSEALYFVDRLIREHYEAKP